MSISRFFRRVSLRLGFIDSRSPVEDRMLRIFTFSVAVLIIPMITANTLLGFPWLVNLVLVPWMVYNAFVYYRSVKGRISYSKRLFYFFPTFLFFTPVWFLNGGVMGSIDPFLFLILLCGALTFKREHQFGFILVLFLYCLALMLLEYLLPNLATDYYQIESIWFDKWLGVLSVLALASAFVAIYRASYERDRERLLSSKAELTEAKLVAENASLAKSNFLAHMSHELRTPLNAITGVADLLNRSELSKEQTELVQHISEGSDVLLNIIADILDLSKVEASKLTLNKGLTSSAKLFKSIASFTEMRLITSEKQLAFRSTLSDDIPEYLRLDELRVKQILLNLITNSIKYSERGVIELNALMSYGSRTELHVSVSDQGIGMSEEFIEKIQEPFFQIDYSSHVQRSGVGLGLSICRGLLDLMEGSLIVQSKHGEGSVFTACIPVELPEKEEVLTLGKKDIYTEKRIDQAKILLVEDNKINQVIMCKLLDSLNIKPSMAVNGKDALDKIKTEKFDIILMDVQMPVMDGLEATKAIKADNSIKVKPFIIALTANALKESEVECISAGMDDYLTKPVTLDKLKERIKRALHSLEILND